MSRFVWERRQTPPTVEDLVERIDELLKHPDFYGTKCADGNVEVSFKRTYSWSGEERTARVWTYLYPVGPTRHYEWVGRTLDEALLAAWNGIADMVQKDNLEMDEDDEWDRQQTVAKVRESLFWAPVSDEETAAVLNLAEKAALAGQSFVLSVDTGSEIFVGGSLEFVRQFQGRQGIKVTMETA